LNPNARPKHWSTRWKAAKKYQADCIVLLLQHKRALVGRDKFSVTFKPPNRHRHDLDNAISQIKAGLDALSKVTGVDDSKFDMTFAMSEPVKGGAVLVEAA
jgi:DNA-binding winged helix-turn-helix (wHTH) protein